MISPMVFSSDHDINMYVYIYFCHIIHSFARVYHEDFEIFIRSQASLQCSSEKAMYPGNELLPGPQFHVYQHIPHLFIWGFNVAFNTVQVISRRVVGRAEETST